MYEVESDGEVADDEEDEDEGDEGMDAGGRGDARRRDAEPEDAGQSRRHGAEDEAKERDAAGVPEDLGHTEELWGDEMPEQGGGGFADRGLLDLA